MINSEVDVYDGELPIIVQKNIISNDINTRHRHNQATNGLIGSIFSKIPYLQWIIVMPILIVFLLGAYFAVNDSDSNLSGHLFFYIIFVILVATTIGFIQVIFSMTFIISFLFKDSSEKLINDLDTPLPSHPLTLTCRCNFGIQFKAQPQIPA